MQNLVQLVFSEIASADIKKHKKSGDIVVLKKIEMLWSTQ
jgi:hypothetical protein